MTNGEKYEKEIIERVKAGEICDRITRPKMLKEFDLTCERINCTHCEMLFSLWVQKEYKEPEVDWSKVAVDTPILVRDNKIKVGDVVENVDFPHIKGVVVRADSGGDFAALTSDGDMYRHCITAEWRKTGNNYAAELRELLDKIGGESE